MTKIKTVLVSALLAVTLIVAAIFSGCGSFEFSSKELKKGKVGVEYNDTVASGGTEIYYELDAGDEMPAGLIFYDDGTITGTPEEAGTFNFTVIALDLSNNEYTADFTIEIEKGTISYSAKTLPDAKTGEPYLQDLATATGMSNITYSVKEGSALPKGLTLSAEGELSGVPEAAAESVTFIIVASAEGCDPVEATFTLKIEEGASGPTDLGEIVFEDFALPDGLVGEEYNQSIRKAYGVPGITYSIKYIGGKGLPKGLEYNSLGIIAGTPEDSTSGTLRFNITAKAEGYDSVTVEVSLRVLDVYVATNRFEAEYIDVSNLKGAGYSGGASGVSMLERYSLASNGRALSYLNCAISFDFNFTAAQTTTAKLTLGLGNNMWGDFELSSEIFKVYLNGEELSYDAFTLRALGTGQSTEFNAYTLSCTLNLKQGDNVLTFEVLESVEVGGIGTATAMGPIVDYIELTETQGEIGWRPRVANTK